MEINPLSGAVGRAHRASAALVAMLALAACAGPNGELARLNTATQQSSPGTGYGVQGGYIGTSGAFTSLGSH